MTFARTCGITVVFAALAGVFSSGEYGFGQPALLVVWCGAFFVGVAAGGRHWVGAIAGFVSAALGGVAMEIGIALKEGVDWSVVLPVVLPLAAIPGSILGLFGAGIFGPIPSASSTNECQACGYDLTGNVSGRCPECGNSIAPSGTADDQRQKSGREQDDIRG